jgi:hypothetical protein
MSGSPRSTQSLKGLGQNDSRGGRICCLLILLSLTLAGCVTNGDFGRVRPSLQSDDTHAWLGQEAVTSYGEVPSAFLLTDDERQLRDLAYPLIEPPYNRQRWDSVLAEWGEVRRPHPPGDAVDRTAYAQHLLDDNYRSATTRYAKLIEDIRNDIVRVGPFFSIANKVADLDDKRHRSMAYVSTLGEAEKANAFRRMSENHGVMVWVRQSLSARVDAYRYALERLVIRYPSSEAVEVERVLSQLRMLLGEGARVVARTATGPVYKH